MGFLRSLLRPGEARATTDTAGYRSLVLASTLASTGKSVTASVALQCVAVYACVRIIAETVASLPLPVYKRLPNGGKERDPGHRLYELLHDAPNPEMTSMEFRETMLGHAALWGNGYAEIQRDGGGRAVALWPLRPDRVTPRRAKAGEPLVYQVRGDDWSERLIEAGLMLHVHGLGYDGLVGYSVVSQARESIGLALAAEEYGGRFFGNGSSPPGVLTTKGALSEDGARRLKSSWEEAHRGLDNAHRVAVLEEGVDWKSVGMPMVDMQFLELRRFQVEEIARLFRVPPHMIQDLTRSTYSNIEHQAIDFVVHTIRPWCVRFEQSIRRALFGEQDRRTHFAEHLIDGLLRGDIQSRYQAYSVARQNGILSANEWRALENMNPQPGDQGDMYLVPLNMVPADQLAELPWAIPTETPGPRSLRAGPERRSGPASRRLLSARHRRLFTDAATRIVRREAQDVEEAARRLLSRRSELDLRTWLTEYYRDLPDSMERVWLPVALTYAEAIVTDAAGEIGEADGWDDEDERFARGYVRSGVEAYAGWSLARLMTVLDEADDEQQAGERLQAELDEWRATRPGRVSTRESNRLMNAAAVAYFGRKGIEKLRWIAFGKSCQYCSNLNRKVVGFHQFFVEGGGSTPGEPGKPALKSKSPKRHPPLHGGCDCGIRAERTR